MKCLLIGFLFMSSITWAQDETVLPDVEPDDDNLSQSVFPTFEMTPDEQDRFRSVAEMLRCPTCQGLSVLESDAAFSTQIQTRVKEQIEEGKSREEILDYFTERYGSWILREPPRKGFNLFAWIFPIALLCIGPLAVWFFVWRQRRQVPTMGARSREALLDEFEALLQEIRAERRDSL